MGQFADNIENIWVFKEVAIAGPKDDGEIDRSILDPQPHQLRLRYYYYRNYRRTEPAVHSRRQLSKTLLMGDDPSSVDSSSDVDDITI
ncbi:hypothetical protein ACNKHV_18465 [Shigella flexneri]